MAKVNYRDLAHRLMDIVSGAMSRVKELADEMDEMVGGLDERDDYIAGSLVSLAHSQLGAAHTALHCVTMLPVTKRKGAAGE